jgi:hypothetical protein
MSRTTKICIAAVLVITFNLNFYAQSSGKNPYMNTMSKKTKLNEAALKNYAHGIESENPGLRKSAIYIAGVYRINGLVNTLIKQFTKEKDNDVKVMIALALYMIGDDKGITAIDNWNLN